MASGDWRRKPGCLLDGAYPRTDAGRVVLLMGWLEIAARDAEREGDLVPRGAFEALRIDLATGLALRKAPIGVSDPDDGWDWAVLEDEIIEALNEALPDGMVCEYNDDDPGTVVIREAAEVA